MQIGRVCVSDQRIARVCVFAVYFPVMLWQGFYMTPSNPAQGRVPGTTCNLCLALFILKVLYVIFFHCIKHKIPYVCRLGNMLNSHTCFPEKKSDSQLFYYIRFMSECLFLVWSVWLRPLPVYPIVFQQPGLPVVKDRRFYPNKKPWHPSKKLYDQRNIKTCINYFNLRCMVCRLPLSMRSFAACPQSGKPMSACFIVLKVPPSM